MRSPRVARLTRPRGALGSLLLLLFGASALVLFPPSGSSQAAPPPPAWWSADPGTGCPEASAPAGGPSRPSPRWKVALASKPRDHQASNPLDQVVMFGGRGCQAEPLADTWTWDSSWHPAAAGPPARYDAAMAFDGQNFVMFGGDAQKDGALDDTWLWNGSNWTSWSQAHPDAKSGIDFPPARQQAAMAYDEIQGRVLLFGGSPGGSATTYLADVWAWNGGTQKWKQLGSNEPGLQPSGRDDMAMAYDKAQKQVVLFGGFGKEGKLDDTWTWNWSNSSWHAWNPARDAALKVPPARRESAMAFDASSSKLVLFGGSASGPDDRCQPRPDNFCPNDHELDDTWTWDGGGWRSEAVDDPPERRQGAGMASDPTTGFVVLFGGFGDAISRNDTWLWGSPPSPPPSTSSSTALGPAPTSTSTTKVAPPAVTPPSPGVRRLVPPSGPTGGGTPVSIQGRGFTGAVAVSFGDLRLDCAQPGACDVVDDSHLLVRSPVHDRGTVDVRVTTANGTSQVVRDPSGGDDQFTFFPPSPAAATDPFGPTAGGYGPGQPAQPAPPGGFGSAPVSGTGFGSAGASPTAGPGTEVAAAPIGTPTPAPAAAPTAGFVPPGASPPPVQAAGVPPPSAELPAPVTHHSMVTASTGGGDSEGPLGMAGAAVLLCCGAGWAAGSRRPRPQAQRA